MNSDDLDKIEKFLDDFNEEDESNSEESSSSSSPEDQLWEYRHFLEECFDEGLSKKQLSRIRDLVKRIDEVCKECDFSDPEGELDMMIPERNDEELDDDEDMSISAFDGD